MKYDQLVASTNKWQSNKELVENLPSFLVLSAYVQQETLATRTHDSML